MGTLLGRWDDLELWLSGLSFFFQALIVMPAALLLSYMLAQCADRILTRIMSRVLSWPTDQNPSRDHTP